MKEVLKNAEERMEKSAANLEHTYAGVRVGRANPAVLDKVKVDYYGAPTAINQLAAVSVAEARVLVIQPWDASALKLIEKAIQASDLGINPANDGRVLRIVFPPLTEERRRDLVKEVKKEAEESKVAIRSIRRDAIEKFKAQKKSSEMTEDDLKQAEKDIQEMTDKFCKEIDSKAADKEKEIMSV